MSRDVYRDICPVMYIKMYIGIYIYPDALNSEAFLVACSILKVFSFPFEPARFAGSLDKIATLGIIPKKSSAAILFPARVQSVLQLETSNIDTFYKRFGSKYTTCSFCLKGSYVIPRN